MKPSEIIREGRNVLFERGWNKGTGQGGDGSLCAVGALRAAQGLDPNEWVCWLPAERRIMDDVDRTFDDVIDLFDKAEKIAEQREAAVGDRFRGESGIQRLNSQALIDWDAPEAVAARARAETRRVAEREAHHISLYGVPHDDPYLFISQRERDNEAMERER